MGEEFIQTSVNDGVLTITMHDPPTRNALGPDMAREIVDRLDQFEAAQGERVLLLTGTEPSFCSGANVRGFSQRIQDREAAGHTPESLPWGKMEAPLRPASARLPLRRSPGRPADSPASETLHCRRQRPCRGCGYGPISGLRHPVGRRKSPIFRSLRPAGADSRRR